MFRKKSPHFCFILHCRNRLQEFLLTIKKWIVFIRDLYIGLPFSKYIEDACSLINAIWSWRFRKMIVILWITINCALRLMQIFKIGISSRSLYLRSINIRIIFFTWSFFLVRMDTKSCLLEFWSATRFSFILFLSLASVKRVDLSWSIFIFSW